MSENHEHGEHGEHEDHDGAGKSGVMTLKLAQKRLEVAKNWKEPNVPISHFVGLLEQVVSTLEFYENGADR